MSDAMIETLIFGRTACKSGLAKRIRVASGLSLREVADAIDTSHTSVWLWETNRGRPSGAGGRRYCEFLHHLALDPRVVV